MATVFGAGAGASGRCGSALVRVQSESAAPQAQRSVVTHNRRTVLLERIKRNISISKFSK